MFVKKASCMIVYYEIFPSGFFEKNRHFLGFANALLRLVSDWRLLGLPWGVASVQLTGEVSNLRWLVCVCCRDENDIKTKAYEQKKLKSPTDKKTRSTH